MNPFEILAQELEHESAATGRLLERVPAESLDWRPHARAMSLGQLAFHVAGIPTAIMGMLQAGVVDLNEVDFTPHQPEGFDEITAAFESGVPQTLEGLRGMRAEDAAEAWRCCRGDDEVFSLPNAALVRSLMLNHLYHHRGQLATYLRILDVQVPATYGRSADESLLG